jgi:hypothetical protein
MSWTGDWADWAGDNPVEAERELARERERAEASFARVIRAGLTEPAPVVEDEPCEHTEVYATGHCADCGAEVEGFEPADAQIFAQYGQTKETAA